MEERTTRMSKRKRGNNAQSGVDSSFRLKKIQPKSDVQHDVFDSYAEGYNMFLYGVAGTGKTYISLFLALKDVLASREYKKVYVVRSAVPSRDLGYLPGKLAEKMMVYEAPYKSMLADLFGRGDAYEVCQQKGVFEVCATSYLRGLTLTNSIIIADEVQNFSFHELDTMITRVGEDCKIIFCGDIEQCDLGKSKYDVSGLPDFSQILKHMESFEFHEFLVGDVVRSGLVKEYILAKRKAGINNALVIDVD